MLIKHTNCWLLLQEVWKANLDIQFVSNAHGAAAYIAAYVSKGETEGLRRAAAEGLAAMPEGSTDRQLLRRIGTTHLASRETSLQVNIAHCFGKMRRGGGLGICTCVWCLIFTSSDYLFVFHDLNSMHPHPSPLFIIARTLLCSMLHCRKCHGAWQVCLSVAQAAPQ